MTLDELPQGKSATLTVIGGEGELRQHFLDMGLIPGAEVTFIKFAPLGDPMELMVQGYELTLRVEDAKKIEITDVRERKEERQKGPLIVSVDHPGLGEPGKFHELSSYHDVKPIEGKLTFALAGNQNCGKTTLFNQLTGSNQHVGNFPGVTVDRKSGIIKGHPDCEVVDLPGIYSLSPYTSEEVVSRKFILEEKPSAIINIVDATNLERNLYLTMQLMELDIPMVLALNMMDEVEKNGGSILINEMEKILQIPVIPISATKNQGGPGAGAPCGSCGQIPGKTGHQGFLQSRGPSRGGAPCSSWHYAPHRRPCGGGTHPHPLCSGQADRRGPSGGRGTSPGRQRKGNDPPYY